MHKTNNSFLFKYFLPGFIAVLYLGIFYTLVDNSFFIWDDHEFLFDDIITKNNLFGFLFNQHYGLYHPTTTLFIKINYLIHSNNPLLLHALSIVIHLFNSILVLKLIKYFVKNKIASLVGFFIYLFHPLNVEVVAWLTSIKDLIYVSFSMLSLLYYTNYVLIKKFSLKHYLVLFLFTSLSLLSKPQAIILPFLFLGFDYYSGRKIKKIVIYEKIPFLIIALFVFMVNLYIRTNLYTNSSSIDITFIGRIAVIFYSFIHYLINSVYPSDLSIFYPYPFRTTAEIKPYYYYYLVLFLVLFSLFLYNIYRKGNKKVILLTVMGILSLLPVIQIFMISESIVNDRYSYFFLIPVAIFFSYLTEILIKFKNKIWKTLIFIVLTAFLISLTLFTYQRVKLWETPFLLFSNDYRNYSNSEILANTLGTLYLKKKMPDSAIILFDKSIAISPVYPQAHYNKGVAFETKNQINNAIDEYNKAIIQKIDFLLPLYRLSNIYYENKNYVNSMKYLNIYSKYGGTEAKAWNLRSKLNYLSGDIHLAIKNSIIAIKQEPDNTRFLYNLALSFGANNSYNKSIDILNKIIIIDNSFHQAYYLRGLVKIYTGQDGCRDLLMAKSLGNKLAEKAINKFCLK